MEYDSDGNLLDVAPYPALYEYHAQRQFEYDHPERIRAIHQLAHEAMLQAKSRMHALKLCYCDRSRSSSRIREWI